MKYIKIAIIILVILIIIIFISIALLTKKVPSKNEEEPSELENTQQQNNIMLNTYTNVTDFQMIKLYFEDYKYKALHTPEEAFLLIDGQYRIKKFNDNIEEYKTYIKNNMNRFQDANIVKYGVTKNGQFNTYLAIDSFDNFYKITEIGINQYTITLDNYTIMDEEMITKYNKASATDKVISNVDKIVKLINEKSYETVYNYLNQDYKNQSFPNLAAFTNYIEKTFFYHNIVGDLELNQQGQNYIITIPYQESISTAAQVKKVTIVMKLKEAMDFEIAFVLS